MEAFSAGGEIWGRRSKELEALAFIPIWDDRLADTQTHTHAKKGCAGQNLSGRARAIFTRAVNLRGFPPGVPTGVGKNPQCTCVRTFPKHARDCSLRRPVHSHNIDYCDFVSGTYSFLGPLRKLHKYGAPLLVNHKWFDDRNGIGTRDS